MEMMEQYDNGNQRKGFVDGIGRLRLAAYSGASSILLAMGAANAYKMVEKVMEGDYRGAAFHAVSGSAGILLVGISTVSILRRNRPNRS